MLRKNNKFYLKEIGKWVSPESVITPSIHKCRALGCLTCENLIDIPQFQSTTFQNKFIFGYTSKNPSFINVSCKTKNLIYLITCSKCEKQYVGETIQPLHKRINGHRHCIKRGSTFLYNHFKRSGHNFETAKIQIIDCLNSYDTKNAKNELLQLEDYWIEKLGTLYPLGLNDKKKGSGNISQERKVNYFNGHITRYKRGRGSKKPSKMEETEESISSTLDICAKISYENLYKTLSGYNSKEIEIVHKLSQRKIGIIYNICTSFCESKSYKYRKNTTPKERRETILIDFTSKTVDEIGLKSIFGDTSIVKLLPQPVRTHAPLQIFYRYSEPISLPICNYGKFLKNIKIPDIKRIIENDCDCETSQYVYQPHGHVISGNLNIVENTELRSLMGYGRNYRLPKYEKANKIKATLISCVNNFITKKCKKYGIKSTSFKRWKDKVTQVISRRINTLNKKSPRIFQDRPNILRKKKVIENLNFLKNKYVICTVDKASNNFVFICKKWYTITLAKELGFDLITLNCTGNTTYATCQETEIYYLDRIKMELKTKFDVDVNQDNHRLPRIFWNPKLHKCPYKARFIAGARKCITKPLNIVINSALKLLRDFFKKYCNSIFNNCSVNPFWSIESSTQFLDTIRSTIIYNIQVYDFTTLYTNLDLTEVEKMIGEIIQLIYSERNKYICIAKYNHKQCFFASKKYDNHFCFSADDLLEAVKYIINNTYIVFGGTVFRQMKGIPMGGNSSSPIADLTVAKCEYNYMMKIVSQGKCGLARLLSNNHRYVDDLAVINYLSFHMIIKDIYPPSLEMERVGTNNKNINYLDLKINIAETISVSVYNKTDDFDFNVISLSFPHSNIPLDVGYNVFYSQILRYGNICSRVEDFRQNCKKSLFTAEKQRIRTASSHIYYQKMHK